MNFTEEFTNYLENNIGDKVNEIFFEAQKELGITSGDINPLQDVKLAEIQSDLMKLVIDVLAYELEEQKKNEPKKMYINYYSTVSNRYESLEVFMTLDTAKEAAEKLYTNNNEVCIIDKELADKEHYDPVIAVYEGGKWNE